MQSVIELQLIVRDNYVIPTQNAVPAHANGNSVSGIKKLFCRSRKSAWYNISYTAAKKNALRF